MRRIYYPDYVLKDNKHMRRGRLCEPHILKEFSERMGIELIQSPLAVDIFDIREAATADAVGIEAKCPVRAYDAPQAQHVVQVSKQINVHRLPFGYLVCSSATGVRQCWRIHRDAAFYNWFMGLSRRAARYIDARILPPKSMARNYSLLKQAIEDRLEGKEISTVPCPRIERVEEACYTAEPVWKMVPELADDYE